MEAIFLSCNNFLLLSALFLLKIASISKSRGTRLPVGDYAYKILTAIAVIQFKKKKNMNQKQIFTNNQRIKNRHLKN